MSIKHEVMVVGEGCSASILPAIANDSRPWDTISMGNKDAKKREAKKPKKKKPDAHELRMASRPIFTPSK